MREIKFRAWDGKDMFDSSYGDWISFAGTPFTLANRTYNTPNTEIEPALNYTVMQYTGLKDKNGKEIYESDIVKLVGGTCDYLPCGIYGAQRHEKGAILIVSKLLSGYTLQTKHGAKEDIPNLVGNVNNYIFWNHQRSLEVIGNIYENPELLED